MGEQVDDDAAPITAEHLIAAMDSAGVERAQVLSLAYFFAFPDVPFEGAEEAISAENDYTARQVARFPTRLVGACSVNPLDDHAQKEVRRCAVEGRLAGLKLHFANSDVDLRDPDHVARVRVVFQAAGESRLPIVVHMRTRDPDYGASDVQVFITELLSAAPDLPVQIAHMAGWGGYDDATDEALATFVQAFEGGVLNRDLYTFDLAATVMSPQRAEPGTARVRQVKEANQRLADRIRTLGTDRVLFASDWSSIPLAGYAEGVRVLLPLSEDEIADIMDNVGPLFR